MNRTLWPCAPKKGRGPIGTRDGSFNVNYCLLVRDTETRRHGEKGTRRLSDKETKIAENIRFPQTLRNSTINLILEIRNFIMLHALYPVICAKIGQETDSPCPYFPVSPCLKLKRRNLSFQCSAPCSLPCALCPEPLIGRKLVLNRQISGI
jgi:hypothetical protein